MKCLTFQVSFVVKAVSALTAAFRLVQLSSCDQRLDVPCLRRVSPHLHHEILENLQKLSFTSMSEMGGTRHHFSQAGRLVASRQIVFSLHQDTAVQPVSIYCSNITMVAMVVVLDILPRNTYPSLVVAWQK